MPDERTRADELFHDAWVLLSKLNDLKHGLPEPNAPRGTSTELGSYALYVAMLRNSLRASLTTVDASLHLSDKWQIGEVLLPPSAKYGRDAQAWLRWLDETWGGDRDRGADRGLTDAERAGVEGEHRRHRAEAELVDRHEDAEPDEDPRGIRGRRVAQRGSSPSR